MEITTEEDRSKEEEGAMEMQDITAEKKKNENEGASEQMLKVKTEGTRNYKNFENLDFILH